jgi:hypothetical protein
MTVHISERSFLYTRLAYFLILSIFFALDYIYKSNNYRVLKNNLSYKGLCAVIYNKDTNALYK